MKNALILHGTGGSPESFWIPSIKKFLESKGYEVTVPQLPNTDNPVLSDNLKFVKEVFEPNEETVMIGHSSGCPLILSLLQNEDVKIKKIILVAGFYRPLEEGPNPILQREYDWDNIKNTVEEIIFINSDNDPWGCDDKMGKEMFDKLGGTLIIKHGEGHMGSDSFNQPYKEFSLVEKLLS